MIDHSPPDGARTDGYRVRLLRHSGHGSVASTVVLAIADIDDVDPTEMEPLYWSVDPDLLEALCNEDRQVTGDVMFTYREYRVTVDTEGVIVISLPGDDDA